MNKGVPIDLECPFFCIQTVSYTHLDVYKRQAGQWADREDGTGKWVRYDADGHMVKGWQTTDQGTYYFDPVYGTMAKGNAVIDGATYYFDVNTGILQ